MTLADLLAAARDVTDTSRKLSTPLHALNRLTDALDAFDPSRYLDLSAPETEAVLTSKYHEWTEPCDHRFGQTVECSRFAVESLAALRDRP